MKKNLNKIYSITKFSRVFEITIIILAILILGMMFYQIKCFTVNIEFDKLKSDAQRISYIIDDELKLIKNNLKLLIEIAAFNNNFSLNFMNFNRVIENYINLRFLNFFAELDSEFNVKKVFYKTSNFILREESLENLKKYLKRKHFYGIESFTFFNPDYGKETISKNKAFKVFVYLIPVHSSIFNTNQKVFGFLFVYKNKKYYIDVYLQWFLKQFLQKIKFKNYSIAIIKKETNEFFHKSGIFKTLNKEEIFNKIFYKKSIIKLNNINYFKLLIPIDQLKLSIVLFSEVKHHIFYLNKLKLLFFIVIIIGFGIAFVKSYLDKKFYKRDLKYFIKMISTKPMSKIELKTNFIEWVTLQNAYNLMVEHIDKYIKLNESLYNYIENIIQSFPNIIIATDNDLKVKMFNKKAEEIILKKEDTINGINVFDLIPEFNDYKSKFYLLTKKIDKINITNVEIERAEKKIYNFTIFSFKEGDNKNGVVINGIDITENVKMENYLRLTQKLESLGKLAGGFAHDFNNILGAIFANFELYRILEDPDEKDKVINDVEELLKRSKELVQNLLLFSKNKKMDLNKLNLYDLIKKAINIAKANLNKNITYTFIAYDNYIPFLGNYSNLTQMFLNLFINAQEAIELDKNGLITVIVDKIFISEGNGVDLDSGFYYVIEITDNGVGIDKKYLNKIFEPFFSKKKSKGTGIGLSIVYSIIKSLNGEIYVNSEKGKGTTFTIYLPVNFEEIYKGDFKQIVRVGEDRDNINNIKNNKTDINYKEIEDVKKLMNKLKDEFKNKDIIFIVDDDDNIITSFYNLFSTFGFRVFIFKNGSDFINFIKNFEESKNVFFILLDIIMPGISGIDILKSFEHLKIDFPVIVCSGYYDASDNEIRRFKNVRFIITKPFKIEEFLNKMFYHFKREADK